MHKSKPAALVTNASDFAGPPAVDALLAAGFRVMVYDPALQDQAARSRFLPQWSSVEFIEAPGPAEAVDQAFARSGRIEAIVSNDHFPAIQKPTDAADPEDLRKTLNVLVMAPFLMVRAAIPHLKAQGGGNIVMITSCRTKLPIPGGAIPDAARAATNALMHSWAIELAPFEIAVNAVAPNFLYSEAYYPRATFIESEKGRDFVKQSVPAGRLGKPDEIGEVIRFLATTKARFLTGAMIDFSGGWPAAPIRPA